MPATRTQIYLTEEQRRRLDRRGRQTGQSMAAMIREAVDVYLGEDASDVDAVLRETFGSMPELEIPSRNEWETRLERIYAERPHR